jgi:ABC-type nitrate/sulfonate/bicarbonate transport system substrate-binding protein
MTIRHRLTKSAILAAVAWAVLSACGSAAGAPATPSATVAASASVAAKPSAPASASAGQASAGAGTAAKPSAASSSASKPAAASNGASASAASKPAAAQSAAPAAKYTLRIAYPSLTGASTPLWLADTQHFFSDRGLNADVKLIEGNVSTNSLVAKEIDVMMQSPTSVIVGNVNGKLDMEYVASPYNHSQFSLMAEEGIKNAADLKGKNVGTDKPGTSVDFQTRLLLSILKLQPSDVQLRQLGLSNVLVPALASGQLQAATLSIPDSFKLESKGYHPLADTYKAPYSGAGAVILRSRFNELAPALIPFLDGYRAGIKTFYDQPDLAKKTMQQYLKESDETILQRTYDFYKEAPFQNDLMPDKAGLQSIIDFIAETTLPEARSTKPEDYIDTSLLAQLPKS